jgi:lysozyme family protein
MERLSYKQLFDTMIVDGLRFKDEVAPALKRIEANKEIYKDITNKVNVLIPWYAIGIVHSMECNCSLNKHIHNGDPLAKRTVLVPDNRPSADPKNGIGQPYTFEESCIDWLTLKGWNKWKDWGVNDILSRFEKNNGMGYQKRGMNSPYLWSGSNHYKKGKFVSDGKFDKDSVSKQIGAAVLLKYFM